MAACTYPFCGAPVDLAVNPGDSAWCPSCGETFVTPGQAEPTGSPAATEHSPQALWLAGPQPKIQQAGRPVLLGLIMLGVAAFLLMVRFSCEHPGHQLARRSVCAATLHSCGKALAIYANQQGGQFPPDIDILVTQNIAQAAQFMCPSSQPADDYDSVLNAYSFGQPVSPRLHEILHSCYVYIPGQTAPADPANVLMYEKKGCHPDDGGNVLFADGHVQRVEPYWKIEQLVAQTKERLATDSQPAE